MRCASNSARTDGGNGALSSTELEREMSCVSHVLPCDLCATFNVLTGTISVHCV